MSKVTLERQKEIVESAFKSWMSASHKTLKKACLARYEREKLKLKEMKNG